jgi:AcrR family transcriptional regulator
VATEKKIDPRIQRTKDHILSVAFDILERGEEPLTLSAVALHARVARRTLYTHWGSVENLTANALGLIALERLDLEGLDLRGRLAFVLNNISQTLTGAPIGGVALLMSAAPHDAGARAALDALETEILSVLSRDVAPMTHDDYAMTVGVLVYQALATGHIPRSLVDDVIEVATARLSTPQDSVRE